MAQDQNKKDESLLETLRRELDTGISNPEEIAAALHAVLEIVAGVRQELLDNSTTDRGFASRLFKDAFDKARALVNGEAAERKQEQKALRRLVDSVLEWKALLEGDGSAEDLAAALEGVEENTDNIRKLRADFKVLARQEGPRGPRGRTPAHEWEGTNLRFMQPDGTWGEWVNLQGLPGFVESVGGFGGGPEGIRIFGITANGTAGPATLSAGGILNIPQYAGSGGGSQSIIDKTSGAIDDVNLTFGFASKPFLLNVNQRTYRENVGWAWNAGTSEVTLAADPGPVGVGGEIYAIIQ